MAFEITELSIARHPWLLAQLRQLRAAITTPLAPVEATIATSDEPVPFEQRHTLPQRRARKGTVWGTAFTCAWFHVTAEVPAAPPDTRPVLMADLDGEAMVLLPDGSPVGAVSSRVTPIEQLGASRGKTALAVTPDLAPAGRLDLWFDAGFNGKLMPPLGVAQVKRLELVAWRDDVEELYHDYLTCAYAWLSAPDPALKQRYKDALDAAWRTHGRCSPTEVTEARAALAPLLNGTATTDLRVTAIGHGHLDLAWLWPLRETHRKARRTFTHQLDNLDADPDYLYGSSQPQQWAWLEREHPDLFARVLDAAACGRLEPQGGLWVEPDMNLPSGESIVRQALYGQRFFEHHLGRLMETCWLPDVFGYNANLPQLLSKAGMRNFLTIKLSWNEHNDFPHRSFVWEGIDGSQVLVHMPPEGTYNSSATPLSLVDLTAKYPEKDAAPEALLVFGSGDGGGGPGRTHLELVKRLSTLEGFPAVEYGTSADFFDRLTTHRDQLPVWRGELYLEKHQGTFTTQAATKRGNRRMEEHLHDLEYLAALAWASGADYPRETIHETWREVLLHQFHDILPGSSITRVHVEAAARHAELEASVAPLIERYLASDSPTPTVTNTLATPRAGHVWAEDRWWSYAVAPFATASCTAWTRDSAHVTDTTLTNDHLRATWGPDGELISLVDLSTGVEHAGECLNRLVVHRDPWSYFDAWDINADYLDRPTDVLRPTRVETFLDGPRAVRRSHYRHGRTTVVQDAVLTPGQRFLAFEIAVDWHERHRMLRAEFRPAQWADDVACEIQYGHYRRSTRNDTPQEQAQYEVCAHRWVDVSDATGGLSLLNDAKYGHRVKEGVISLNLLRAPIYPDPKADRGRHEFTYALFPHAGAVEDAETLALAAHLNSPVLVGRAAPHDPVFTVDAPGVQLAAVKVAEDRDALILRLYESRGRATSGSVRTTLPVERVAETDLLERVASPADLNELGFAPFELKTLRVEVRRP